MVKAPEQTLWPTMVKKRVGDVFVGLDNSAWLYRAIPMSPVADAKTNTEKLEAGEPIKVAFEEIADVSPPRGKSRGVSRSGYRNIHLLLVEFPVPFRPPENSPIGGFLKSQYPDQVVYRRLLVLGVKLNPIDVTTSVFAKGGLNRAIDSVAQTLSEGGVPLSDFDEDYAKVSKALDRAGLTPLTKRDQRDLDAYWNSGGHPDVPYLTHRSHMHFMDSSDSMAIAERVGLDHCEDWGDLDGHRILTFASVDDFDFGYADAADNSVQWASQMVNSGAAVVSIRGALEKPEITAAMLRHQKAEYLKDLNTRANAGKMSRADQEKKLQELDQVEAFYKGGKAPVSIIDTSVIVGFNGRVTDIEQVIPQNTSLNEMLYRQVGAWSETMLCSNFRANPNLHDLPSNMVAYSGLPALSIVGDPEGAIVGFTEKDSQPSYLSPVAASKEDSSPITLVAAGTGTGKSVLMLYMADQFARIGSPVVIIDPKALSLDTMIPTPDGWRLNGDLAVGDRVFDRRGDVCNVVALSPLFEGNDVYEVRFDDGQVIKADADHRWVVATKNDLRRGRGELRDLTTREIVDGIADGERYSIPLGGAAEYPSRDLDIDPYLLGAWLGDGASRSGCIHVGKEDTDAMLSLVSSAWGGEVRVREERTSNVLTMVRDETICIYGHDDYVPTGRADRCGTCNRNRVSAYKKGVDYVAGERVNESFQHKLNRAGLLGNKHIPMDYLTSSIEQRLALLQGLMDTDGTVKNSGACRISLSNSELAIGTLELIRSLGIKATMSSSMAKITEDDPDNPGQKRRRETSLSYTISFHTLLPVFRADRKLDRMESALSRKAQSHYVRSVTKIESEPTRCIRVDSEDHTYLAAGYIPTHNTGSDHSAAVELSGGQVARLDEITKSDGILDPIRFSKSRDVGVSLAASVLSSIDPWGGRARMFEIDLLNALRYGVEAGATCSGQALKIAYEANIATRELVEPLFKARNSPMFSAIFGVDPNAQALSINDGITLIMVGSGQIPLPAPGMDYRDTSFEERVGLAMVRMMVFGSSMALTGRGGVIMLDEAHVFLNSNPREIQLLGRVARSQEVLPMLSTLR